MKKFDGILICTDLDGTLLRTDKSISKENLEAIEYFKAEGGLFTFITGRMPFNAFDICELIKPNAPIGCINGGGIFDYYTKKYVWTHELPRAALDLADAVYREMPWIGFQVNTFDSIYFTRDNEAMQFFRRVTGTPLVERYHYDVSEPLAKIVFGDIIEENIQNLAKLLAAHPKACDFDFIRSEKKLYEILPKGCSKGDVLPRLAKHLGIDMRKTIAVGDYDNDVSMIESAGVGVAVANAMPEAKAVADYITVSNEEHALAKIIFDIESGRIKTE